MFHAGNGERTDLVTISSTERRIFLRNISVLPLLPQHISPYSVSILCFILSTPCYVETWAPPLGLRGWEWPSLAILANMPTPSSHGLSLSQPSLSFQFLPFLNGCYFVSCWWVYFLPLLEWNFHEHWDMPVLFAPIPSFSEKIEQVFHKRLLSKWFYLGTFQTYYPLYISQQVKCVSPAKSIYPSLSFPFPKKYFKELEAQSLLGN